MNFEEQIMSKDKYPGIFSKSNGSYCVYCSSKIFRNSGNIRSRDVLRPIERE